MRALRKELERHVRPPFLHLIEYPGHSFLIVRRVIQREHVPAFIASDIVGSIGIIGHIVKQSTPYEVATTERIDAFGHHLALHNDVHTVVIAEPYVPTTIAIDLLLPQK